jgi:hypothetical protein
MTDETKDQSEVPSKLVEARAYLRGHLTGLIGFDGEFIPIKIAIMPDGALVTPVMVAMLRSFDITMFLPDEDEASMHMQISLEEIRDSAEHAALCDRWRVYHGEPEDVRWARVTIDAAKFGGCMFDGDALMQANPLATLEPKLIREINTNKMELLKTALTVAGGLVIEDPRLVGVDPLGFDVRGRFEITRLRADPPIMDHDDAIAALEDIAGVGQSEEPTN